MNFCRGGAMVFMHPERVLREAHVVHRGEAPRAAASFNLTFQRMATPLGCLGLMKRWSGGHR